MKSFENAEVKVKLDVFRVLWLQGFCSRNAISAVFAIPAVFQRVWDWMSTAIQKPCLTNSAESDLTFGNNKTFLMPLFHPSPWIFTIGQGNKNTWFYEKTSWL